MAAVVLAGLPTPDESLQFRFSEWYWIIDEETDNLYTCYQQNRAIALAAGITCLVYTPFGLLMQTLAKNRAHRLFWSWTTRVVYLGVLAGCSCAFIITCDFLPGVCSSMGRNCAACTKFYNSLQCAGNNNLGEGCRYEAQDYIDICGTFLSNRAYMRNASFIMGGLLLIPNIVNAVWHIGKESR
eukprot:TRINITY_DN1236_c0_g2_i1.p1 TRINITY_DN1236_c0_g2~~TRINITY_DN1236_c0_g2_i1.p1  ORF type:complete len:184 (-),score=1.41 TRINITY_DN1236_c0_g2_i1:176-727(-)